MAEHAERTSRLAAAADVRRRGDTIRFRRQVATAALGVVLIGAVGVGVSAVGLNRAGQPIPIGPAGPTATSVAPSGPPDAGPTGSPDAGPTGSADADDPLLSGQRQVAIVRTEAFESAVSLLDEGRLAEVDGVEGRRLFVIVPQGQDTFRVRTAEANPDGTDTCWQVVSSGTNPLTVGAAACSVDDPRQRFTIAPVQGQGDGSVYAISSDSAYLQHSSTRGLILEELGDATLTTFFRFVDNGPA